MTKEETFYHLKSINKETGKIYCIRLFVKEKDIPKLKEFYKETLDKGEEFLVQKS